MSLMFQPFMRQEQLKQVDFIFDNENLENLDPEFAFKGRCKKFLTLFDIYNLDNK